MFDSIDIQSYRNAYTLDFVDNPAKALCNQIRKNDFVFIDQNIFELYDDVAAIVQKNNYRLIRSSEEAKSFQALEPVIDNLLEKGITKTDRIIAIGGGITQDITAFTASILFRGINWLFFPTNLLSQADSCIGSKTSINYKQFKNQLGGFYPPHRIFIAPSFLKTLPERDVLSGLGEMMHYFCVSGREDFDWAKDRLNSAICNQTGYEELIHRSLTIKKAMIETDEFDSGPRNIFNYGHSFGHALESVTNFAIPHGIAVCFGIDIANCISNKLGLIPAGLRNEIRKAMAPVWEKVDLTLESYEPFFAALGRDKKNEGTNIKVILTKGLGEMFKTTLELDASMKKFISSYFHNKQWRKEI